MPYTYTLNPAALPANDSGRFVGVPAGDYIVEVTDAEGCGPVPSNTLSVAEPAPIVKDSVITKYISCNGANDAAIHIYVSGGTPPYLYSVDNEVTYTGNASHDPLGQGTYDVFVKDARTSNTSIAPSPPGEEGSK